MDYMFYTPPNTEPTIDHSVPFDQDLALLEGQHFAAVQRLDDANESAQALIHSGYSSEDQKQIQRMYNDRVEAAKSDVIVLEQQIADARQAKQTAWEAHRAKRTAEEQVA